jgi:hypothetical protein
MCRVRGQGIEKEQGNVEVKLKSKTLAESEGTNGAAFYRREIAGEPARSGIFC